MLQKTTSSPHAASPKKVFISYSHMDHQIKDIILLVIQKFESRGLVSAWHDSHITAGQHIGRTVSKHLATADLVLLLVSTNYLRSTSCQLEIRRAMAQRRRNKTVVIPLIIRECEWHSQPFRNLLALPPDGLPLANKAGAVDTALLRGVEEGLALALVQVAADLASNTHGATVFSRSLPGLATNMPQPQPLAEPLKPTAIETMITPVRAMGVAINRITKTVNFFVENGDQALLPEERARERVKVLEFVKEVLSTTSENCWVNLSPYQSRRMLPRVLKGTHIGRALLETDLQLKRFSASLLHPDCASGQAYWAALYARARSAFGTDHLVFPTHHKVTILADRAAVYVKDQESVDLRGHNVDWLLEMAADPSVVFGFVVDAHWKATCESERDASKERGLDRGERGTHVPGAIATIDALALEVFQTIVLPIIEREVNEGAHFLEARQMLFSLIVANWMRGYLKANPGCLPQYEAVMESEKPHAAHVNVFDVQYIKGAAGHADAEIEHLEPALHKSMTAEEMQIPENAEYYAQYTKLYRRGLYHIARLEQREAAGEQIARIYVSGAMNLADVPLRYSALKEP